jgi:hypothetical protein
VGFDHLIVDAKTAYLAAQAYLRERGFLIIKTDFWASVQNMVGMKLKDKIRHLINWYWYKGKPWKWLGGKGYVPHRIKKMQKKQKKAEAIEKAKREAKGVPGVS